MALVAGEGAWLMAAAEAAVRSTVRAVLAVLARAQAVRAYHVQAHLTAQQAAIHTSPFQAEEAEAYIPAEVEVPQAETQAPLLEGMLQLPQAAEAQARQVRVEEEA
jgi:hypothetical protein